MTGISPGANGLVPTANQAPHQARGYTVTLASQALPSQRVPSGVHSSLIRPPNIEHGMLNTEITQVWATASNSVTLFERVDSVSSLKWKLRSRLLRGLLGAVDAWMPLSIWPG